MITIRAADLAADLDIVLHGASEFVRLANRPELFPEPGSEELAGVIGKLMSVPGFTVLLAEHDGRMVGGIGYWVGPYLMSMTKIELQELFWWCAADAPPRAAMMLLREAVRRGTEAGATVKTFHRLTTSPEGVDAAYRRIGLAPIQVTYMGTV